MADETKPGEVPQEAQDFIEKTLSAADVAPIPTPEQIAADPPPVVRKNVAAFAGRRPERAAPPVAARETGRGGPSPRQREQARQAAEELGEEADEELAQPKPRATISDEGDEIELEDEPYAEAADEGVVEIPPIDPGLRWALMQKGMTPAAIDAAYETDPVGSMRFFQQAVQDPAPAAGQPAPGAQDPEVAKMVAEFRKDPTKFEEDNGKANTLMFRALIARMDQQDRAIAEDGKRRLLEERDRVTNGLGTQHPELYGTSANDPDPKKRSNRQALYELADDLRNGHRARTGQNMSPGDALKKAHLIVSAGNRRQQAARDVRGAIKNRSRQMTLRPGGRETTARRTTPEQLAEQAYAARFSEITGMDPE
jgi:hypothetical protein